MDRMNHVVFWYQQKIGTYDKQLWEQSVEQKVLRSIHQVPKKSAKAKPELIDVDLVRGSTFSKTKPQHGFIAVSRKGLMRVLFLPFYLKWWDKQTSRKFTVLLFLLYTMQVAISGLYIYDGGEVVNPESISLAHILVPVVLMLVLGLIHAQIIATRDSHKSKRQTPKAQKRTTSSVKTRRRKTRPRYNRANTVPKTDEGGQSSLQEMGRESSKQNCSRLSKERRLRFLPSSSMETDDMLDSTLNDETEQDFTDFEPRSQKRAQLSCSNCQCHQSRSVKREPISSKNKCSPKKSAKNMTNHDRDKHEVGNCSTEDTLDSGFLTSDLVGASNGHVISDVITQDRDGTVNVVAVESHVLEDLGKKVSYIPHDENGGTPVIDNYNGDDQTGTILRDSSHENPVNHRNGESIENGCNGHENVDDYSNYSRVQDLRESSSEGDELCVKFDDGENLNAPLPESSGSLIAPEHNQFILNKDLVFDCDSKTKGAKASKLTPAVDDDNKSSKENSPKQQRCNRRIEFNLDGTCQNDVSADSSSTRINSDRSQLNNVCDQKPQFRPVSLVIQPCDSIDVPDCECNCHDSNRLQLPRISAMRHRDALLAPKESTGISSAESECESTPHTPTLHKDDGGKNKVKTSKTKKRKSGKDRESNSSDSQTSVLGWESTLNTQVTSSDSSSCTTENTDISDNDSHQERDDDNPFAGSLHQANSVLNNLASGYDNVSCMIWEGRDVKKVDLSVLDIGWTIIQKVDKIPEMCDYIILGFVFTLIMSLLPVIFRAYHVKHKLAVGIAPDDMLENSILLVGSHWKVILIVLNGVIQRFCLGLIMFFLLSVAERTFKQRLLYAKHFCYLTSSRRAKKYELPHFRLNKVRNIKTWLSLRSYLKKRGPQRSVDCIVSAAFLLAVMLLSLMCVELLQDSGGFLDHLGNWELVAWCMGLGIYLLRFMTLGTKINKKYRNFSVLITEQINLYLQMEQKPHKKDELTLANNVLKLAEALLKELESPFKISGLSANPFLYNVTKIAILSAVSAVLSELLGFKLRLFKIKSLGLN